ncbi:MAG: GNAT family N-acetyltransferase [Aquificaceae bacterium]
MEIRLYRKGDEKGIVELFKMVFNKHMSMELWEWKYRLHFLWTPMVCVAEDDGKIIAHYGAVPRRCSYFGKEVISAVVSDSMVHPSYRGMFTKGGVFVKLTETYIEAYAPKRGKRLIDFGYGFPMERARLLALKLNLYEDVESCKELLVKGGGKRFYESMERIENLSIADKLWKEMKDPRFIINYRDRASLEWRYSMPDAQFSFFLYRTLFFPKALLVLRTDTDPPKLYDYVGNLQHLSRAFSTLHSKVGNFLVKIPPWTLQLLKEPKVEDMHSKAFLVANKLTGPSAQEIRGRFFYMWGDEDT